MHTITLSKYAELLQQLAKGVKGATFEQVGATPEVRFEARLENEVVAAGTITLRLQEGRAVPTGHIGRSSGLTGDLKTAQVIAIAQSRLVNDMTLMMASLEQFTVRL